MPLRLANLCPNSQSGIIGACDYLRYDLNEVVVWQALTCFVPLSASK